MFPAGNPAKSAASQALVLARGGTRFNIDCRYGRGYIAITGPCKCASLIGGGYRCNLLQDRRRDKNKRNALRVTL